MNKVKFTTNLNENLVKDIKVLAVIKKCDANNLIEEGIEYILDKYGKFNEKEKRE